MVPELAGLPPESTPVRPPPIPHQDSASAGGFTPPSWASARYQNAFFPQGYLPSTPYLQTFTPFQQPGSYHPPPVGLPNGVPPTPDARILPNSLPTDWIGSASGWNPNMPPVTPYNGPQPHDGQASSPTRMFSRYQEEEEEEEEEEDEEDEEEEDEEEGEEVRKSTQPAFH